MTPSRKSITWRVSEAHQPAKAYESVPERFTVIWDPSGWHLWDESRKTATSGHLVGVYATLKVAKAFAGLEIAREAAAS